MSIRRRGWPGAMPALFLAVLTTPGPQAKAQAPPADLAALLKTAATAVDSGDLKALRPLCSGDPAIMFSWARPRTLAGRPGGRTPPRPATWKGEALRLPGESSGWAAVFWDYHPIESVGDHVYPVHRLGQGWELDSEIPETDTQGFRLVDHDLHVQFELPQHGVTISDSVLVERLRSDASRLQMRLSPELSVDMVKRASQPLDFSQVGSVLYIAPPAGRQFRLTLDYHGTAYHPDRFVDNAVSSSEVVLSDYWYPTIARLPTTNTVTVTVPRGWTAVSQGYLAGRVDQPETTQFTYRMDVPNCYFTLDAGPYFTYQRTVNGRTYSVYLLKPDPDRARKQLETMDSSFRLFERLWGPYPFTHYGIVETNEPGWHGALESYTFTTYGPGLLPSPNPHEWGHTWWGGFVPNTYLTDIWNETFASYSESVYFRHGPNPNPGAAQDVYWARSAPGADRQMSQVDLAHSADALAGASSIVGYRKGEMVMQNLEQTLGFDTLMRCMRTFRDTTPKGQAATWADFERTVDRVTGKDYAWWFEQWLHRTGLPELRWGKVTVHPASTGYAIDAEILQTGAPYRLEVPIQVETASSGVVKATRDVTSTQTEVHLLVPSAPLRLLLDPEMRLPRVIFRQELPAQRPARGAGPAPRRLMIAGAADAEWAKPLAARTGAEFKLDSAVTDADLRGVDLTVAGSADSNGVWRRLAAGCPFAASAHAIRYHGKSYADAAAEAFGPNPVDSSHRALWITPGFHEFGRTNARVLIFDPDGRLLDGEAYRSAGGPTVYDFPTAALAAPAFAHIH